ncbi:MAG: hypothetical protein R3F11_19125 [Verrucomicrobiales bacterium]
MLAAAAAGVAQDAICEAWRFPPPSLDARGRFGHAVALANNELIAAATDSLGSQRVYAFRRSASGRTWSFVGELCRRLPPGRHRLRLVGCDRWRQRGGRRVSGRRRTAGLGRRPPLPAHLGRMVERRSIEAAGPRLSRIFRLVGGDQRQPRGHRRAGREHAQRARLGLRPPRAERLGGDRSARTRDGPGGRRAVRLGGGAGGICRGGRVTRLRCGRADRPRGAPSSSPAATSRTHGCRSPRRTFILGIRGATAAR